MRKHISILIVIGLMILTVAPISQAADPTKYKDAWEIPDWAGERTVRCNWLDGEFADAVRWELLEDDQDDLRPNSPISRAELAQGLAKTLDTTVNNLVTKGIVPSDISQEWVTRKELGQWAGRAAKMYGLPDGYARFFDTDDPDILAAAKACLVRGRPGGNFEPDELATRCEVGIVLVRLARSINSGAPTTEEILAFEQEVVEKLYQAELVAAEKEIWPINNNVSQSVEGKYMSAAYSMGYPEPNRTRVCELELEEAYSTVCRALVTKEVYIDRAKTWRKLIPEHHYYSKDNGKWVLTHIE